MNMVTCQYTPYDLDTVFCANLSDDLPHTQLHVTAQNFVSIFGDPHEMKAMMKRAVFTFVVLHDHTLHKNEP